MNVKKMTLKEIRELYFDIFPEANYEDIFDLPLEMLINQIEDEFLPYISDDDLETNINSKHFPSRKKKCRRTKKNSVHTFHKKSSKKWKENTKKSIPYNEYSNNRSYLKKISSGYVKILPKKSIS